MLPIERIAIVARGFAMVGSYQIWVVEGGLR
jgi:hypothetical protein